MSKMASLAELKTDARNALLNKDLDAALMLFEEIHEKDSRDIRSWAKMAELLEKTGRVADAIREYNSLAAYYADEGFVVQAIAISKIVLRHAPDNRRALERLQELSRERGDAWSGDESSPEPQIKLQDTPLLSTLSGDELQGFIEGLTLRTVEDGEMIVRAGDEGGPLFLVGMGVVRLETVDAHGERRVVRRVEEGDFFGEYAFMSRGSYQDDAVAEGQISLMEIDRVTFDSWVQRFPSINETVEKFYRQRVLERVLAVSELFRGIPVDAYKALTGYFTRRAFADGERVVTLGDAGDSCFLIRSGRVAVSTEDFRHAGKMIDLGYLNEGDFFGEVSLLSDKRRTATVVAVGDVELMELKRSDFNEIVKSFPQVLNTVERYQRERVKSTIK
ncbi:MAG: cyclic nucleotide-binding domain-containing protein, partial [Mariprofundales bacterium]|nr:cyclic nucleotide-binding domain-containing protein [Mariprofundales bacterium]